MIKMVTVCLRMMEVAIFALGDQKVLLVSYEKYGTLSLHVLYPSFLPLKFYCFDPCLDQNCFKFQKSLAAGVDCDYGRTVLYLLYLMLCKEVKRLKVALCCYYGCRDMEGELRCIKR